MSTKTREQSMSEHPSTQAPKTNPDTELQSKLNELKDLHRALGESAFNFYYPEGLDKCLQQTEEQFRRTERTDRWATRGQAGQFTFDLAEVNWGTGLDPGWFSNLSYSIAQMGRAAQILASSPAMTTWERELVMTRNQLEQPSYRDTLGEFL